MRKKEKRMKKERKKKGNKVVYEKDLGEKENKRMKV